MTVPRRRPPLVWSFYVPVLVIVALAVGAGVAGSWVLFGVLMVILVAAGVGGYTIWLARQQERDN